MPQGSRNADCLKIGCVENVTLKCLMNYDAIIGFIAYLMTKYYYFLQLCAIISEVIENFIFI